MIDAGTAETGFERVVDIGGTPIRCRIHFTVNGTHKMYAYGVKPDGTLFQDISGDGGFVDEFNWEKGGDQAIADLVFQFRRSGIPQELLA